MEHEKVTTVPLFQKTDFTILVIPGDYDKCKIGPYLELIGSLMYLLIYILPDIMLAVSNISQFFSNPRAKYWNPLKNILRYGKENKNAVYCFRENIWVQDWNY